MVRSEILDMRPASNILELLETFTEMKKRKKDVSDDWIVSTHITIEVYFPSYLNCHKHRICIRVWEL